MKKIAVLLVLIVGCTSKVDVEKVKQELIEEDKKYALKALENGTAEAFTMYADTNALMLAEGAQPITGKDAISKAMEGLKSSIYQWEPEGVDVAASGDLGYTWGRYVVSLKNEKGDYTKHYGKYLTVWKKQQDGSWKYSVDVGNGNPAPISELKKEREKFNPEADPFKQLEAAIQKAESEHKRIFFDVGGEWCIWCQRMDIFIKQNPALNNYLSDNFVVVKINYSKENKNEKFLSQYPKVGGYPHIFILDTDGKFLHSQNTGELEQLKMYNYNLFMEFLKKWSL